MTLSISFVKHPGPAAMMTDAQERRMKRLQKDVDAQLRRVARLNARAVVTISFDIQLVQP